MDVPEGDVLNVLGLMELLLDYGGVVAVDDLRDLTGMEFEELEPVIETAEILGLAAVKKQFLKLTEKGKKLGSLEPEERKEMLSKIIKKLPIFKKITEELKKKEMSLENAKEFIRSFEPTLHEKEVEKEVREIISWGSYANIIDYDPHRKILRLK